MAAFRNLSMMMARVKAVQLPPLVAKHSSKCAEGFRWSGFQAFSVMCASSGFCIFVIAEHVGVHFPICLSIALVAAVLSGLCLAEFLSLHAQGCNSVYSCLYQSISEFTAFTVGWTWLMSLSAVLSVVGHAISSSLNGVCNGKIDSFTNAAFEPYDPDIVSIAAVILAVIISILGITFTPWWLVTSMPSVLLIAVAIVVAESVITEKSNWLDVKTFGHDLGLEQVLTGTAFCYPTLLGAHSVLRLTTVQVKRSVGKTLGTLNIVCYLVSLLGGSLLVLNGFYEIRMTSKWNSWSLERVCVAVSIVLLCLLVLEYYQPLLTLVKEMASDGLICRCLSRRWKPFCQKVPNLWVFILTASLCSTLTLTMSPRDVIKVVTIGPLFISTVVVMTVMIQRYKDRNLWQYEPMLQNGGAAAHQRSRKRSTEFRPSTNGSIELGGPITDRSDSEGSSDTDIDAVFEEYKDNIRMSDLSKLEFTVSDALVREPTASSSFQAKLLIAAFVAKCVVFGVTVTVSARTKTTSDGVVIAVEVLTLVLSLIALLFLSRLPQNKNSFSSASKLLWVKAPTVIPMVPWIPAFSLLLIICLLVHIVVEVWHVFLCWILVGLFLYLSYGIRNSTAASSFNGLPVGARLSLQPFPFPKEISIKQVMLPERRKKHKVKG